jgi:hypothetical protein
VEHGDSSDERQRCVRAEEQCVLSSAEVCVPNPDTTPGVRNAPGTPSALYGQLG